MAQSIPFLLVEEFAERLAEEVVDLPVAEEQVVGVEQLQLLLVIAEVLLRPLVADSLADHGHVQTVNFGVEIALRVSGEDGAAGVVLLAVDWDGEGDLDWANGVVGWHFRKIDF
jgi:hypothetical protein